MQFNNIVANSALASQRTNEFLFTINYQDYIIMPKSVSLSKCSIPNTMLSFRATQLSIFLTWLNATYEVVIQNGYYDDMAEFIPMLNNAIQETVSSEFTFSYDTAHECLKLTNTSNHPFTILPYSYSPRSCVKRLGFNENFGYASYSEGDNQVVYATGLCRLTRTTGFFLVSNLVSSSNYTASPNNVNNIIDYIPIELSNLAYGDSIVVINSNIPQNRVTLSQNESYNATSSFTFQILDDEFQTIDEPDKGANTILFLNLDYD